MMKPIKTKHTNVVLGAPIDWDAEKDGECIGLPVSVDKYEHIYYSWWQPNLLERLKLLFGFNIRLAVFSSTHPPVSIDIDKVKEEKK